MNAVSVVVPCLNEAQHIQSSLSALQSVRKSGEIIVVDGGSRDNTVALARPLADKLLVSQPGRARQMNAGAGIARGEVLWFVHADSYVPANAGAEILAALAPRSCRWGRFDVRLSGNSTLLRVIERAMNLRSRISGIATGDQGIFVARETFEALGGFADIPLMEDIELCTRLKAVSRPACLKACILTSSRRWETNGIVRTMFLMWLLRLRFAFGASPGKLARIYQP